jgi:hypothetical protein
MPDVRRTTGAPGFCVFRRWTSTGGKPGPSEVHAAVLRSQWRIDLEYYAAGGGIVPAL